MLARASPRRASSGARDVFAHAEGARIPPWTPATRMSPPQRASKRLAQGTPVSGPGASLSARQRGGQTALKANGVSRGKLTPVVQQRQRQRRRGASVAAGAGRRGIRVHARAPAGTLGRRGGGACAGECARRGGGVFSERAGGGGAAAAASLGAAWVSLMSWLLRPADYFADQQGAVQLHPLLALLSVARFCGRGFLHSQVK